MRFDDEKTREYYLNETKEQGLSVRIHLRGKYPGRLFLVDYIIEVLKKTKN